MVKPIGSTVIKKILSITLAAAMITALFTGCGTAGSEAPSPAATEQPTPAAENMDNQTPEIRAALPADLLSDELNVFSDIAFPDGYTVYAADYQSNTSFFFYDLYLTAAGDPKDIITYVSNLLGDGAEENIRQNIDYYNSDGGVGIDGTQTEGGLQADCYIEATKEDDYDYDYVEGCTLRLRAKIEDPSRYGRIIEENYNLNSLSDVAEFFVVSPISGKSRLYVRKSRNNAQIDAVYNTVEDVAGVMETMKASMTYKGFDESINVMNLLSYGEVENNIFFDPANNSISIFQTLGDSGKNYKDYKTATSELTDYGFQNSIESDALCEFRDEDNSLSIAINIPQWGSRPNEWENSCMQFLKEINGYLLVIWYYPDEGKYTVQADKDDTSAKFTYDEKTGEFTEEFSTLDTVKEQFENMFADQAQDDVYMQCIELFKNYVSDTFGMSIDELYALAAKE